MLRHSRIRPHLSLLLALAAASLIGCSTSPEKDSNAAEPTGITPTQVEAEAPPTTVALDGRQIVEYQMALKLLDNGNYAEASKTLKPIAGMASSPAEVKANFALSLYKQDKFEEASQVIAIAIKQQDTVADYHNLAGLIAMDSGSYVDAESAFKQALTLNNDYALAHYNIALLYDLYYQEIPEAYKHYLKYLNLVNYEDKETVQWVEQLRYSVENQ